MVHSAESLQETFKNQLFTKYFDKISFRLAAPHTFSVSFESCEEVLSEFCCWKQR